MSALWWHADITFAKVAILICALVLVVEVWELSFCWLPLFGLIIIVFRWLPLFGLRIIVFLLVAIVWFDHHRQHIM